MDPYSRHLATNFHHEQPDSPPLHTVDLGALEDGNSWSNKGEEDDYGLPYDYSESGRASAMSSRFSSSSTSSLRRRSIWQKIRGKNAGWLKSMEAIVFFSWVNIFILVVPILWVLHFMHLIPHLVSFGLSFLALIPVIKLLDFGAENLALYCGPDIGDLILISLNNAVETILALWLLANSELRLLQSSIIGVVVLRLLLIPGVSFIVGGTRVASQELHPHITGLNHSLLTTGVLAFLLPIAFFTALDRGIIPVSSIASSAVNTGVVSDYMRGDLLKMSRGMAVILLAVYVCARVYLHNPPGGRTLHERSDAPEELKELAHEMEEETPEINFCISVIVSVIAVTLMAITTEILVESIEPMRHRYSFSEEWFGLILLPLVSFSADALVSIVTFVRNTFFGHNIPHTMASTRHVDDAIQFVLFWAPVLVLLGWIIGQPFSLLFDLFEVAILIGSCFLLNYVTEDSKTNWAEGTMLVGLYFMVALAAWFYPQQPEIRVMLSEHSIAEALKGLGNLNVPSPSTTSVLQATATVTTSLLFTTIATASATPTASVTPTVSATPAVSTSVAKPTSTSAVGAATVTSASPAVPTGNQELSEELQQLIRDYLVLADTIEEEISSLKPSPTFRTKQPKEHRRIQYAQDI